MSGGYTSRIIAVFLASVLFCGGVSQARGTLDSAPVATLDPGGHTDLIKNVLFTPDGERLISAGDDKTIRIWNWREETTERVIRVPGGPGDSGKVFAVAISPDGRTLAAAGWMWNSGPGSGHRIRLYDVDTGVQTAALRGHDDVVNDLAFSPDGRMLLSGGADRTAIIWEVATGRALHRLRGHRDVLYDVAFTADGARAVTGADDHELWLWDARTGEPIKTMIGHGEEVSALAVSADGLIASGDANGEIRLWDAATGALEQVFSHQTGGVGALIFSPDGHRLLSTCAFDCDGDYSARLWDVATGKQVMTYGGHDNIVLAAAAHPTGRYFATGGGGGQEIHVWSAATGERMAGLTGVGHAVWAVGFSPDGQRVGWGSHARYRSHEDRGPLETALDLRIGAPAAVEDAGRFQRAILSVGGWSLSHAGGERADHGDARLEVRRDGAIAAVIERDATNGIRHRSYSFTPDGRTVLSGGGGGGALTAYDRAGEKLADFVGQTGEVFAMAPSSDGRLLLTGGNDQIMRLWSLSAHELILSIFAADPPAYGSGAPLPWIAWTPQGYFTGSPGAGEMLGWRVDRGGDGGFAYVTAAQFGERLFRPDIVFRAVALADAGAAVREARDADPRDTPESVAELMGRLPPEVRVLDLRTSTSGEGQLTLAIRFNGLPIFGASAQVGGSGVRPRPMTPPADMASAPLPGEVVQSYGVDLRQGENQVRFVIRNAAGPSAPSLARLRSDRPGQLDQRGVLRILAVGVDRYPRAAPYVQPLDYAGADAAAFVTAARQYLGPYYESVETDLLMNDGEGRSPEPTKANIEAALARLMARAEPQDTVALFYAGHGARTGGDYHLLPTDFRRSAPGDLGETALDWRLMLDMLAATPGRKALFLDACYSAGEGANPRLTQDAADGGLALFSSDSGGSEACRAVPEQGRGLFTQALLEGLKGAAFDQDGALGARSLGDFLQERVRELSRGLQTPEMFAGAGDFLLTRR